MPRGRLAILSLLVVATLTSGCATTQSVAETPAPSTPPVSETPTPTATAAPDPAPVRAFDGDCDRMLTAEQRQSFLGPGTMTAEERHRAENPDRIFAVDLDPVGTTGGLECMWFVAEDAGLPEGVSTLRTTVLPATAVPNEFAARYAVARCEPSYDSGLCRLGRTVGDDWIMATAGWAVYEAPVELLDAAIDAVAANLPDATQPRPAAFDDVWSIPDCVQLGEAIGLEELIGPYLDGYWEGSEQPEEVLFAAAGVERTCPVFSDSERLSDESEFFILTPQVAPGLAWQWEQLRSGSQGFSSGIDVVGATDAFAADLGHGSSAVFATDGTNVARLYADSDDVEVAAEILGRIIRELSR